MYDVIVIGAGPAGISASIYLKRANLNVLVIYSGLSSLEKSEKIENYYGFENGISGESLYENGIKQAVNLGIELKNEEVLNIENQDNSFIVETVNEKYESKAVVLATGSKKTKPNIDGIDKFEGKGISYCAICDGFFFKGKNVAVLGDGQFAIHEANYLKDIVNKVTILTNGKEIENVDIDTNEFEIILDKIVKIDGNSKVESIEFQNGKKINIDGIFIAIGKASGSDFAKRIGVITENESIKVDENMKTNIDGLYSCGDATGGLFQISKAVYDGTKASLSIINYLKNGGK